VSALFHRSKDHVEVPAEADIVEVRPHWRLAACALIVAIAALVVGGLATSTTGLHGAPFHDRVIGVIAGIVFVVTGVIATRATAKQVYDVVASRTGPSHAGVLRWLVTIFGYLIVTLTALGMFDVGVQHLLLGGALTGIVIGIAAQQSLSNLFAGVVLLLSRPFNIGDVIRIRSGAFGGQLEGTVSGMGMTYVTLLTDEGPLSLPNSTMLASAVGPAPGTGFDKPIPVGIETPQEIRDLAEQARQAADEGA
jgi:small-conductance mechanosensitive channel